MHRKGGKKRSFIIALVLFSFWWIGFLTSAEAQDRNWFDLSDVNPVGKALDHVEGLVPGLTLKGFLRNYTRMPLAGNSNNDSRSDVENQITWAPPRAGNVTHGGLGRRRIWDFDAIEWQGELEARYKPSPDMEFVVFLDQQYDAAFDWDHYWRSTQTQFFDPLRWKTTNPATRGDFGEPNVRYNPRYIAKEMKFYHSTMRWLREAYGNFFLGPLTLTVGKQQTVWGKIDFEVIDIVNPKDRRIHPATFSLPGDGRWRRIPTWATKALYTFGNGNFYFEGTWIPDYETDDPKPGGWAYDVTNNPANCNPTGAAGPDCRAWPSPRVSSAVTGTTVNKVLTNSFLVHGNHPSAAFVNSEWFGRLGFNLSGWDGFLFYGNYWSRTSSTFRRAPRAAGFRLDSDATSAGCLGCIELERKPTRLNSIGLAIDKTFWFLNRNWDFIYEGEYRLGQYWALATRNVLTPDGKPGNRANPAVALERNPELFRFNQGFRDHHSDGVARRPLLAHGIEFETFAVNGKLSIIAFFVHAQVFGWDGHLVTGSAGNRHRAQYTYAHTLTWKFSQTEDRLRVSLTNRYRPNDGSLRNVFGATYVLSDYLSCSANLNYWGGIKADGINVNDANDGAFRDRDLLDFRFNYNF